MAMKSFFALLILVGSVLIANAQKQGICGKVFWVSGNQMPGPGSNVSSQQGVAREIFIYKITTLQDVDQKETFFSNIKTEFVTKSFSNTDGSFKIKLPPGAYSVFVNDPQGFFANLFDKENRINPTIVKPNQFSWMTINIDYEASY
jgi:hypothetical protein